LQESTTFRDACDSIGDEAGNVLVLAVGATGLESVTADFANLSGPINSVSRGLRDVFINGNPGNVARRKYVHTHLASIARLPCPRVLRYLGSDFARELVRTTICPLHFVPNWCVRRRYRVLIWPLHRHHLRCHRRSFRNSLSANSSAKWSRLDPRVLKSARRALARARVAGQRRITSLVIRVLSRSPSWSMWCRVDSSTMTRLWPRKQRRRRLPWWMGLAVTSWAGWGRKGARTTHAYQVQDATRWTNDSAGNAPV